MIMRNFKKKSKVCRGKKNQKIILILVACTTIQLILFKQDLIFRKYKIQIQNKFKILINNIIKNLMKNEF